MRTFFIHLLAIIILLCYLFVSILFFKINDWSGFAFYIFLIFNLIFWFTLGGPVIIYGSILDLFKINQIDNTLEKSNIFFYLTLSIIIFSIETYYCIDPNKGAKKIKYETNAKPKINTFLNSLKQSDFIDIDNDSISLRLHGKLEKLQGSFAIVFSDKNNKYNICGAVIDPQDKYDYTKLKYIVILKREVFESKEYIHTTSRNVTYTYSNNSSNNTTLTTYIINSYIFEINTKKCINHATLYPGLLLDFYGVKDETPKESDIRSSIKWFSEKFNCTEDEAESNNLSSI